MLQIKELEDEMNSLKEVAKLFEVGAPDFKQLKACRKEISMLKVLWDMIVLVRSSFADWNTTLWKDINVEQMEMDCKKFVKEIRALDKEMECFTGGYIYSMFLYDCSSIGLDSTVKNMHGYLVKGRGRVTEPCH